MPWSAFTPDETWSAALSNSYFWIIDSLPRNGSTKYQGTLSTQMKLKL